jgi:hypothetical protein
MTRPHLAAGRLCRALLVLSIGAGGALIGCEPEPPPVRSASVAPRAGVVVEPDEIRIGDTAWVEIAVVTPPDHRVSPLEAPGDLPGFWLIEAEALPLQRDPSRWVHRTRFHVRARETGSFSWPAGSARVETPSGEEIVLEIDGRPLEVIEGSPEFAGRVEPFSFRAPPRQSRPVGFAVPALLGAAATLAVLGLLVLVRAVRARRGEGETIGTSRSAPWRAASAAIEAALASADEDPVAAADAASAALRVYVTRRYGAPAECSTTEELAAMTPPFALGSRWPELLRLLRGLDAARFRPDAASNPVERSELGATLRAAQRLLAGFAPHEPSP